MSSMLALFTGALIGLAGPTEVRIDPSVGATEILVTYDGEVTYRDFTMEGPNRLVVDLIGAAETLPLDRYDIGRGGVLSLSSSRFGDDVVRLVLELEEMMEYEVVSGRGMILITFPNPTGAFAPWSSAGSDGGDRAATEAPATVEVPARTPAPAPQRQEELYSFEFNNTPVTEVLFSFSEISGRSIVAGNDVQGLINAKIDDQPWDAALQEILAVNGFTAREVESGIIRVDALTALQTREAVEQRFTRAYRINYATAEEVVAAVAGVLSANGQASALPGTNSVVVTDIERVHEDVERMIRDVDIETPVISISAKIIFVNRTDIADFGVIYDLKDSAGNQLNQVNPGAIDLDQNGQIDLPQEALDQQNAISLGGNSIAALGNANARIANPTLTLLSSLIIGRHTLLTFVEALQSLNLSDIQATPSVTVMDNQQATIQVGERTPLRVIDAGAQGGGQGALPQATVEFQETGIILEATPHVTANDNILLELRAERSAPQLAESDVGLIFNTQNATSRVLVRDGETVVIGGLFVTETQEFRSGIPLLMDLPLLGGLFRTTRTQTIQRDLIILVTPNIVRPTGQ